MEYIFGTVRYKCLERECLKTKGNIHSNLSGLQTIETKYPDRYVVDTFFVEDHYHSAEDSEGNCYDWYIIDNHNTDTDMFSPQKENLDFQQESVDAMLVDYEYRLLILELGL